jgi:hypothetical protein
MLISKTHLIRLVSIAAFSVSLAGTAAAAPGDDDGRYTLTPTDGGFVRLDRQTGAMSFCTKADAWTCSPMVDSVDHLKTEVERLETENKALKTDKKNLEEMLGMAEPGKPAQGSAEKSSPLPGPGGPTGSMPVPTEKDVDKVFDYFEGMVKKLRERLKRLEKEEPSQADPKPL